MLMPFGNSVTHDSDLTSEVTNFFLWTLLFIKFQQAWMKKVEYSQVYYLKQKSYWFLQSYFLFIALQIGAQLKQMVIIVNGKYS